MESVCTQFPTESWFKLKTDTACKGSQEKAMADISGFNVVLRGKSDTQRVTALHAIYSALDEPGVDTEKLAANLRAHGVLNSIASLVASHQPDVHQSALLLIATLTTDDIDAQGAELTIKVLKEDGAFDAIFAHLFSNVVLTLTFASAIFANCCARDEVLAAKLLLHGGADRLAALADCDQPEIAHSAAAALRNLHGHSALAPLVRVLHAAIALQRSVRRAQSNRRARTRFIQAGSLRAESRIRALPSLLWT